MSQTTTTAAASKRQPDEANPDCKVICLVSAKGGTGETSLAINLAAELGVVHEVRLAIAGRIVRFGRLALNMNRRIFFQTAAALALLLSLTVRAGDWPQFRGLGGNGVAREYKAQLHWGPTNNGRWKATFASQGKSSPSVSQE